LWIEGLEYGAQSFRNNGSVIRVIRKGRVNNLAITSVGEEAMQTHAQFFCYVYDAPEGTPNMYALDADSWPEAVSETRRMMLDDARSAYAEIWDGAGESVTRIDGPLKPGGLLRSLRRARPFSRLSRP